VRWGITVTRRGLNRYQDRSLDFFLQRHVETGDTFHHGCCLGVDSELHRKLRGLSFDVVIIGHPPSNTSQVDEGVLGDCDKVRKPLPYLERNWKIVQACRKLLVVPGEFTEQRRSGTWATYRYSIKQKKPHHVFLPDGRVLMELTDE